MLSKTITRVKAEAEALPCPKLAAPSRRDSVSRYAPQVSPIWCDTSSGVRRTRRKGSTDVSQASLLNLKPRKVE